MDEREKTGVYRLGEDRRREVADILSAVFRSLQEKGYSPVDQLVGYLLSGDPTYVTSHRNARTLIRQVERDRIIEELVRTYVEAKLQPLP